MWHGAIPFVDIWDRKPIGLFLLYAFFRPFSVTGVAACQVGALLFAVATAWVITRIAKRFTNGNAALFAGVLYLIYLPIVDGAGGQSPVFYNLFMALAALLVLSATNFGEPRRLMRAGAGAMALVGIAMQVKYSAVVEGLWFGLALLWLHNRIVGDPLRLAGFAVVMISLALLPTVLVFGVYAASGHGAAFIDANVLSVLRRVTPPNSPAPLNLLVSAVKMTPILTLGIVAAVKYREVRPFSMATTFLLGWSAFAFAGFFVIGNYFDPLRAANAGSTLGIGGDAFCLSCCERLCLSRYRTLWRLNRHFRCLVGYDRTQSGHRYAYPGPRALCASRVPRDLRRTTNPLSHDGILPPVPLYLSWTSARSG